LEIDFGDDEPVPAPSKHEKPKLSPRMRRLQMDESSMRACFSNFPYINIHQTEGDPPERYVISYIIRGIEKVHKGKVIFRGFHQAEIKLTSTYPRTAPVCRMLTPVFHPNIEPSVICIGDHWTAAEKLCNLVVRIGELIAYQSHNIKSPLDGEAAMWTDMNMHLVPTDDCDLLSSVY